MARRAETTFSRYKLTLFEGYLTNGPLAENRWSAVLGSHLKKKQKEFTDFRKQLLSSFNKSTNRGKVNHFFSFVRSLSVSGPVDTYAFSKVCIKNALIDSRPYYRFDAFSNKTF